MHIHMHIHMHMHMHVKCIVECEFSINEPDVTERNPTKKCPTVQVAGVALSQALDQLERNVFVNTGDTLEDALVGG